MLFCSEECYRQSSLPEKWEALCETHIRSPGKLSAKRCKEKYRQTDKGKAQRQRESLKRYGKQKATKAELKTLSQQPVLPDQDSKEFVSEKPSEMDTFVSPVPVSEVHSVTEQSTPPCEVFMPTPSVSVEPATTLVGISQPPISQTDELRRIQRNTILKTLFSGKPERAILSPEEVLPTPPGVIPCVCKRPGCDTIVIPRSVKTEKRFCSRLCMNTFRNAFQTLKEAWKATRCAFLKLLVTLFKLL